MTKPNKTGINWDNRTAKNAYSREQMRRLHKKRKLQEGQNRRQIFMSQYPLAHEVFSYELFDNNWALIIQYRHCLLNNYDNWSFQYIADMLEISKQRVSIVYNKAMNKLDRLHEELIQSKQELQPTEKKVFERRLTTTLN